MSKASVPGPQLSNPLTLRRQLRIYEDYVACEDVDRVAETHALSPEVIQAIIERVPREAIPLTQIRKARLCLQLEELARTALGRLEDLYEEKPWTFKQCLTILNASGTHFARILAADTPLVQNNSQTHKTLVLSGDDILTGLKRVRNESEVDDSRGNGNRVREV